MRKLLLLGGLAAALALPVLAAPDSAEAASCRSRKATGTIVGGVGGLLLGDAVTRGSTGPIVGGIGGALVGREIGKSGCRQARPSYRASYSAPRRAAARAPTPARTVYYDPYGRDISAPSGNLVPASYRSADACRAQVHSFYDERGRYVERPVTVCDR